MPWCVTGAGGANGLGFVEACIFAIFIDCCGSTCDGCLHLQSIASIVTITMIAMAPIIPQYSAFKPNTAVSQIGVVSLTETSMVQRNGIKE